MEPKALKKARVMTRPKSNTLDPQGVVVKSNLERSLGIKYLKKVSIGRYIEVELEEGPEEEEGDAARPPADAPLLALGRARLAHAADVAERPGALGREVPSQRALP